MKKLHYIGIGILFSTAIILSTWSLIRSYSNLELDTEYTMYIGTNDKDSFKLEIPLDEARSIVHNTMMDYFSNGFTMYDANGVWRDENNQITLEYTFICVIEQANEENIYKAADELIEKLNQNTILIVSTEVKKVNFYNGK